jgi:hypothetical protein
VLALALVLHGAAIWHFAPPRLLLSDRPVASIDYTLHMYQVDRIVKAFKGWGKLWSYDPQVLAGQPAGALEDLTSKGMELFVLGLDALGVSPSRAFNLFILLAHLLVPLWAWLAAWGFGASRIQRAVAVLSWVVLWWLDSFLHWVWFCGMISWALASCMAVPLAALVYRAVERRAAALWPAVLLLAVVMVVIHPFSAVVAAPSCAAIYLRRARRLPAAHHVWVVLTMAAVVLGNLPWLLTAFRFWHYVTDPTNFLRPSPLFILYDFLDLTAEPWDQGGIAVRTLFRVACLFCAGVMLWRWRRDRDPRLLPLGLMLGLTLALSYFGGLLAVTGKTQPYRNMVPATLSAAIPAALLLPDLLRPAALRSLGPTARVLLVLALLLVVPRVARTVLVHVPGWLPAEPPSVVGQGPRDLDREPLSGGVGARLISLHHQSTPEGFLRVRQWLQRSHRGRGRVAVYPWVLAEYLARTTDVPILGGLFFRAIQHLDAHLFRWYPAGDPPGPLLREYLERYAVGYVIVDKILPRLEWRQDLLQYVGTVKRFRIYRTRINPSYFLRGSGRVVSQSLNSIKLDQVQGPDVVLRFHWLETLRCRPGCRVERHDDPGQRVGFIRVRNPPEWFEIYNGY